MDEGNPRIKSISIAGIPAENIQVDPVQYTIKVQLPAIIPEGGLIPIFELTDNTEIQEGLSADGKLDIAGFCSCSYREQNQVSEEHRIVVRHKNNATNNNPASLYRLIVYSPEGCLKPIPDVPITYTKEMSSEGYPFFWIQLPVQNLYRKPYIINYFFKNLKTGETSGISTSSAGFCLNTCGEKSINTLSFPAGSNWKNGEYEVSLLTICDTNRIVFPQPLVIKE